MFKYFKFCTRVVVCCEEIVKVAEHAAASDEGPLNAGWSHSGGFNCLQWK